MATGAATGATAAIRPFPTAGLLPPGLVLRHLRPPDDYAPMNAIANAIRAAEGDDFYTTDEQFQKFYENLSRCDAKTDVAVAERAGRGVVAVSPAPSLPPASRSSGHVA